MKLMKPEYYSKVTPPMRGCVSDRPRLFERLDRARARPVVFISAPPGAGKTTLAWSYLAARDLECVWYSVDATDADIASFFHHLQIATERVVGSAARELEILPNERMLASDVLARQFFRKLFALTPGLAIVFDNLHELPTDCDLFRVLPAGLADLPQGRNALLLSRADPPPTFARLRSERCLQHIEGHELRFEVSEVELVCDEFSREHQVALPDATRKALAQRSQGWAAGLVLLIEVVSRSGAATIDSAGRDLVFEYFATEVLQASENETQQVLLRTAMLEEVPAAVAIELTEREDAPDRLRELSRRGYFIDGFGGDSGLWRYHPLYRAFLRAQAPKRLGPGRWQALMIKATEALHSHGHTEQAIELLAQLGEWQRLSDLLVPRTPQLLAQGRHHTVTRWIGAMPVAEMDAVPWLRHVLGLALMPVAPETARRQFELAYQSFRRDEDIQGSVVCWSSLVHTILMEQNDFTTLDHWMAEGESQLVQAAAHSRPLRAIVYAGLASCTCMRYYGDDTQLRWLERALEAAPEVPDPSGKVMLGYLLYCMYATAGRWRERALVMEFLVTLAEDPNASALARTARFTSEAYDQFLSADFEASDRASSTGLAQAEEYGVHLMTGLLLASQACCALCRDDRQTADAVLEKMRAVVVPHRRQSYGAFHLLVAWREMLDEHWSRALRHLEVSHDAVTLLGSELFDGHVKTLLGLVYHYLGNAEGRDSALVEARKQAERGLEWTAFGLELVEAEIALDRGDREEAMAAFEQALHTGDNAHTWTYYGFRSGAVARLLAEAITAEVAYPQVCQLIQRLGILPPEDFPVDERWPWRIRLWTLGRFGIEVLGQPLRFRGKMPRRPFELLQLLVARGGSGASEHWLSDTLWPDSDGAASSQSLATTLHRLRRLLGDDLAVRRQGGIIALDRRRVWIDSLFLTERLAQAAASPPSSDVLEKADALYRGVFLPAATLAPVLVVREQLKCRVAALFRRAGDAHAIDERWNQAVSAYERSLVVDPTQEQVYRSLMRAYQALGSTSEALSAFERCRLMLAHELGTEVTSETLVLVSDLRR
jgi:ATP/maltotriose-dependent transcriptional regulator MalT/DNA-binding SARP family transcriptional activator